MRIFLPLRNVKLRPSLTRLAEASIKPARVLKIPARRPKLCSPGVWALVTGLRVIVHGQPGVVDLTSTPEMPKAGFYAVASGRTPGIYSTWSECEAQVKGYTGAKYKKFSSQAEAQSYIKASNTTPYSELTSNTTTTSSNSSSPPRYAPPSSLPPRLADLATKGWRFTPDHRLVVYTDGSGLGNGKKGARAGLGVWWGSKGEAFNSGELLSVIRALEICPFPDLPIEIRTDSQYTIMCMTTYLPTWIKKGFTTTTNPSNPHKPSTQPKKSQAIKNADMVKHLLVLLRRRRPGAGVRFKHVYGHSGFEGNEGADRLAKMGAAMPEVEEKVDWLDPDDEDVVQDSNEPSDVELDVDENWLMSPEELEQFEREFKAI